jgi:transcriptional regulator with XRE-family HTH domain
VKPTVEASYGDWLREMLERAGLTITGLSKRLGVSRMTVHRWLKGESYPLPMFSRVLRLLGRDYGMPPPPPRPPREKEAA